MSLLLVAALIFFVTLVLVIRQPFGFNSAVWSTLGAAAAWATNVVSLHDIPLVWHIVQDATFTLIALILISLVLDAAGVFEWAALHMAHWAQGRGMRLFFLLNILSAVMAALFTNDGAVLIMTPLLVGLSRRLQWSAAATLAVVMSGGFMADAASLPFKTSNLVNIIAANQSNIGFVTYVHHMWWVNASAVLLSMGVLWAYFRHDLPTHFVEVDMPSPRSAIKNVLIWRAAWVLMPVLMLGYLLSQSWRLPVSAVAIPGALVMVMLAARSHDAHQSAVIPVRTLLREAPWQVVVFSLGMYLVVYGLGKQGMTAWLAGELSLVQSASLPVASLVTGVFAAALSSMMNNLPAVLVLSLAIAHSQLTPVLHQSMVYASIIGCDLGPKITPLGSLATLLWLHILAQRGIYIGWGMYFRTGVVLTLPVLVLTLWVSAWMN